MGINVNEIMGQVAKELSELTDDKFHSLIEEARCGELRWLLEYGWNPDLDEFFEYKECYKHMWE